MNRSWIKKRRQQLKKQGGYMRAFRQYGHVLYSDDHGKTWHRGEAWEPGTTENTVVELADGEVMGNGRCILSDMHGNRFGHRAVTISRDGGEQFGPLLVNHELPEPACQGQLLRYSWPENDALGGRSRIFFCNPGVMPSGQEYRIRMTVRLSDDEGRTWPVAREIYPGFSAYSGLVRLPDEMIGVIFERDDYASYSFSYNALGLRTELNATVSGTADFQNTYTYDAAGRMTRITQTGRGGNSVQDKRVDLDYNTLDQFSQITRYESTAATDTVAVSNYSYDQAELWETAPSRSLKTAAMVSHSHLQQQLAGC